MTVADLAASVGVSRPTIWSWEHARSRPRRTSLAALAVALGVSEREILDEAPSGGIAPSPDQRPGDREKTPQLEGSESLSEAINRAKDQIARLAGTERDKVRIIIEI